jgi:Fic family protein
VSHLHDLGGLPDSKKAADIWRGIWYEEAHNSTAIEGNTLVLKQVEVLLSQGLAIGGKELREYAEVRGYADAAEWVYKQASNPERWNDGSLLTISEVRGVHEMVMTPVWSVAPHEQATDKEAPGKFRQHDIHPFPGGMTPISWVDVPVETNEWLREVRRVRPDAATLPEWLAKIHSDFEKIHPFIDGNGRTGRLLVNLLLVRLGYPPAIIYKKDRPRYLRALQRADDGDVGQLGELFAHAILDNLNRFVLPVIAGPEHLLPLAALATKEVSADALRTAASRGRLPAVRVKGNRWHSTRKHVDEYVAKRYRRNEGT